jgi:hypothetical protein
MTTRLDDLKDDDRGKGAERVQQVPLPHEDGAQPGAHLHEVEERTHDRGTGHHEDRAEQRSDVGGETEEESAHQGGGDAGDGRANPDQQEHRSAIAPVPVDPTELEAALEEDDGHDEVNHGAECGPEQVLDVQRRDGHAEQEPGREQ